MWIDQYKDAIEQAAYVTGVTLVATDDTTVNGKEDDPILYLMCDNRGRRESLKKEFKESLCNSLGEDQPFAVYPAPYRLVRELKPVYELGAWRL